MAKTQMTEELKTLKRIETLVATIARVALADKIAGVFKDTDYRFIYEHTGEIPIKRLSQHTGMSPATISRLWNQWERGGLLVKDGKSYSRVF